VQPPLVKAVESVRSGGTVVSPRTDGRESYWFLAKICSFIVEVVRPGGTVWSARTDDRESYWFLRQNFQFFFLGLEMWYGRVVRADPTVLLVTKVTGTCETYKFLCIPSHALVHQHYLENN
jgi:hypothetical protein